MEVLVFLVTVVAERGIVTRSRAKGHGLPGVDSETRCLLVAEEAEPAVVRVGLRPGARGKSCREEYAADENNSKS
jgi:hypothetical protein